MKLSKDATKRAQQLAAEGVAQERIAKILSAEGHGSVTQPTVSRVLARAASVPPTPTRRASGHRASPLLQDDIDPIAALEQRLREIREFITEAREAGKVAAFKDLVKLEADVAARLLAIRPPVPPDPKLDPANAEALNKLLGDVAHEVAATRGTA